MLKGWSKWLLAALVAAGLGSLSASAQVITGTIYGTVQDESHGAMPGVTVTVKNVETGVARMVVTDGEGKYLAQNLSLGNYRVDAELQGFQTAVRTGIQLTVGREAEVNFTLSVGSLTESVEVTGEAPLVETTKSQLAALVDQRQISELPLNSRSYTDLALLTPGVMTQSRNGTASFNGTSGGGVKLAINGARPTNTGFYVDGMDTKDAFGRTPGSAAGTTLGVDTVREFQVLTSNFSAQYGGSGGVLNAVTKSGTNRLHGNAFWFRRDSKLDAKNHFDTFGKPPFTRDQPGFTIGGPIKKDKTFFFVSYEHLKQRQTTTTRINVPGDAVRAGFVSGVGQVVVNPTSALIMSAMPKPNGTVASNGIGDYIFQQFAAANENYAMFKVDQQLGQKDSFFVRLTTDYADDVNPVTFPNFNRPDWTRGRFMIGEYNRIISASVLNTARFSFNKSDALLANTQTSDIPTALSFVAGRPAPQMVIPGFSSFGNDGINDRGYYLTSIQGSEKFSYTKGMHALVAGADINHTALAGYSSSRLDGRLVFQTLQAFLTGAPQSWEYLIPGTGSDPCGAWAVEKGLAASSAGDCRKMRQNQYAIYLQDDLKPRSNLTVNLGMRWEFVDGVHEKDGKISNIVDFTARTEPVVDPFFNAKKNNIGPRVGAAWDPKGDGKTSIRGGFGIFYQPLNYATWQIASFQNAPFFIRTAITNASWPPVTAGLDPNVMPPNNPTPIEVSPNTPYYRQFNATYQRQLTGDLVVSATYAGSKGRNLASTGDANPNVFSVLADGTKFWPVVAVRQNTAFGSMEIREFHLISDYNSMQLRVTKRFGAGLQVQSSYTLSKNQDDGGETQGTAVMDRTNYLLDYGLSQWDVRHNFTANFIYQLPFFEKRTDAIHWILGGWQVSGLLTAQGGYPRNVVEAFNYSRDGNVLSASANNDRPNLVSGADASKVIADGRTENPDGTYSYADVSAYALQLAGTHGNLVHNALVGPGTMQFDGSFVKNVPFGKDRRIELRAEFFNLFNRINLGNPNVSAFTSATGPNPTYGRITSAGTARQGQVAVKVIF